MVGEGNFGAVYLVRRRYDGARLVLKQPHSDGANYTEDADLTKQARREVG